jgi:membrane protein YdbS with pleckstrin-like domain
MAIDRTGVSRIHHEFPLFLGAQDVSGDVLREKFFVTPYVIIQTVDVAAHVLMRNQK